MLKTWQLAAIFFLLPIMFLITRGDKKLLLRFSRDVICKEVP